MSKKLKTLFGIVTFIFATSIAGFTFLFLQTEKTIKQIATLSVGVRDQDIRSAQAQKLVTLLKHTTDTQQSLKAYLISDTTIVSVINTLESFGERAGVTVNISSLSADDTNNQPIGSLSKVRGRVEVKGNWSNILTYMHAIEELPFKMIFTNISLKRDMTVGKGKPMWNMTFAIEFLK